MSPKKREGDGWLSKRRRYALIRIEHRITLFASVPANHSMFSLSIEGTSLMASLLSVDDEASVLGSIQVLLEAFGHTVRVATNVPDALASLRVHQCDLVLVDCVPDSDWSIEEAKGVDSKVRIALHSGMDSETPSPLCLVDDVFQKPVPPPELFRKITELLDNIGNT